MNDDKSQQVSMVISRRVKPGRAQEFEEWSKGINAQMEHFDGFGGFQVVAPVEGVHEEHVAILHFDSAAHLKTWVDSEERKTWLAKADPFTELPVFIQPISGLQGLFTFPGSRVSLAPPKYKMFVLVCIALYPLVLLSNLGIGPYLGFLPVWLRILSLTMANVAVMTWIMIPSLTWLFRDWLAPR